MCIPRVQWKEVVMYFCLHAFWQSNVIIHKRLAAVTQIRESASCQKKQTSKLFWVMQNYCAWYAFHLLSHLTGEEQLWKWKLVSGTPEPQRTSSVNPVPSALLVWHFRYLLHLNKSLFQKEIWSLCPLEWWLMPLELSPHWWQKISENSMLWYY